MSGEADGPCLSQKSKVVMCWDVKYKKLVRFWNVAFLLNSNTLVSLDKDKVLCSSDIKLLAG